MFWNNNQTFKNIIFILMIIFLIWFIAQINDIALLAFGAFVLACALKPIVNKLSNYKFVSRGLASTVVIISMILIIVLFLIPIISISAREIHQLTNNIPNYINNIIDFITNKTIMNKKLIEFINLDAITSSSSQMASDVVNKSIDITKAIVSTLTVTITMGIIVFYMINDKNIIEDAILLMFPQKMKKRAKEVYENIEQKVGGYVIAQILTMTQVAICTALGLLIIQVPYAILLGLIAGLFDIVPIVGPTLACVIGVLCAFQNGWVAVILAVIVYLIVQWSSNNFVKPLVFGKFLNLHPLIIIFAFLIAAKFLGVWGVILSPAIAATLLTLFDELYVKNISKNTEEHK